MVHGQADSARFLIALWLLKFLTSSQVAHDIREKNALCLNKTPKNLNIGHTITQGELMWKMLVQDQMCTVVSLTGTKERATRTGTYSLKDLLESVICDLLNPEEVQLHGMRCVLGVDFGV